MKHTHFVFGLVAAGSLLTGCSTKAGTGTLLGAGLGAGAGALIAHNPVTGAVVGGAIGAVSGAIIGNALDSSDRYRCETCCPQTLERIDNRQPLAVADIKQLSAAGLSDDVIISQIQSTNTTYQLSAAQIIDLKNAGVSQRVIDYMVKTSA